MLGALGELDGLLLGEVLGELVGLALGEVEGLALRGKAVGSWVGHSDGYVVGNFVG